MRVLLATNEFPPYVYGGAGVHVEYLSRELAKLTPVEVRSFHDQTFDDGALHVRGIITRRPPPVSPKLDAARIKKGKPPITKDYVTVHIGYVTDRQGRERAYEEGRGHDLSSPLSADQYATRPHPSQNQRQGALQLHSRHRRPGALRRDRGVRQAGHQA